MGLQDKNLKIPEKMAVAADLPFGSTIQTSTGGRQVIDHLPRITKNYGITIL